MQPTICDKCQTENKQESVVCVKCGAKLVHKKKRFSFRFILIGYNRFIRFIKNLKAVLLTILLFTLLVLGLLYFFLFVPFGWEEHKYPTMSEGDLDIAYKAYQSMIKGTDANQDFELTPKVATFIGNQLLYPPELKDVEIFEKFRKKPNRLVSALEKVLGKSSKAEFVVIEKGDMYYEAIIYGRIFDKLPWRLLAQFRASREKDGDIELLRFKAGNLRLPKIATLPFAVKILQTNNPYEILSINLIRIESGKKNFRNTRDAAFSLKLLPIQDLIVKYLGEDHQSKLK